MTSRPLEIAEYNEIIRSLNTGFVTQKNTVFRPNKQVALALQLEANLGLRIGDVLSLRVRNFWSGKLELREEKTGKLQFRNINTQVYEYIRNYVAENQLLPDSCLFNVKVRAVQKQLKMITDYLGLENVSTHSFRKMYATAVYEANSHNLGLVKDMLNHADISTTQRYIRISQQAINAASAKINFLNLNFQS